MEKKQYARISLKDYGTYVLPARKVDILNAIDGELDGLEGNYIDTGTELTIEIIELTENEFKELPEFTGH